MDNQNSLQEPAFREKEGFKIDYKRIIYRALKFWYLIFLSLGIALFVAFLSNRYATRLYPITASIIIGDAKESSGGESLFKSALGGVNRNYLNELYVIRSYPVIQSVIESLNFSSSFYKEGSILTNELYGSFPITAHVINTKEVKSCKFIFSVIDKEHFTLKTTNSENEESADKATFAFDDTIKFNNVQMVFSIVNHDALKNAFNRTSTFIYTAPEYLTGSYVGRLSVGWAQEGAGVINLSIIGSNPVKEIDFINGLIRYYQAYDLEKKNQAASRTIDFIATQLKSIRDSLSLVERRMERFKEKNVVTDMSAEASRIYEKLQGVELQKTGMILQNSYYQYLIDYIKNGKNLDQAILPSSVGISDGILSQFVSTMILTELEIKMMMGKDKLDNPLIHQRSARLQEVKNNILEAIKNQQLTDKIRGKFIDKQLHDLEGQLAYLPGAERKFISISRNYTLLENLYNFLLQRQAEAGISKASASTDIGIINPPMAGGPISPKTSSNYMTAMMAGLGIPLVLFVLLELFSTRVQSKEDIEKSTSVPFVGGVGHKKGDDNLVVLSFPKSAVAESFRALRSNLLYFIGDKSNVVILISSSISGEGKTFSTINLATVLAISGKKTLIVGADLRRPKLFGDFKLNNDRGLSSYLAGFNKFDDVVQPTGKENLDMISAGPVPPNPSELIMGNAMKEFFVEARKRYDYIIVDSPPLAIVADAFVLTGHADHILFIARQNYTPKSMLRSVEEYYQAGRLKNISIFLNDIYKSGPGYGYGHNYGYGYGYGYVYGKKSNNGYGYYSE